MAKSKKALPITLMLADASAPIERRRELLRMLINDSNPEAATVLDSICESLAGAAAENVHAEKVKQLSELIRLMEEGPLRSARFIELSQPVGTSVPHAQVILDDGTIACTVVPDEALASSLRLGERVLLEGRGHALLQRASGNLKVGEEALLERRVDERHIEVSLHGQQRWVFLAAHDLIDQLNAGTVVPGATLVVSSKQMMATGALPAQDDLAHYKYLQRCPVPDVIVERDIGAPPRCIAELTELIRLEMTQPDLRRRYRLRRCVMKLLSGVSGSGKTLAVQAVWRRMYEVMSEVTGVPIDKLPPRVFRLRMSEVLSMWLGESDKNLSRFFSEVEQLAAERFTGADGKEYQLPVLAILEEVDGLAQARGHDPIHDRILTTVLQCLDTTRVDLKDKLIIYLGTTNEPQQVDRAFFRRIGGSVEHFGRLNRPGFVAVLQKHLHGLPLASNNGHSPEEIERQLVADLSAWLFSPNGSDRGLVELGFAGSSHPDIRYRRDFLTGALIDRAVQQAAGEASRQEELGLTAPGLSLEQLLQALDQQIRTVVDQLNEHNVNHYLDVPDAVRVASVRRLPQPAAFPFVLQQR